jgi:hypothetical protein
MSADPAISTIRRLAAVFLFLAALAMIVVLWLLPISSSDAVGLVTGVVPQIIVGFVAMYAFCGVTAPSVGLTCIKYPLLGGFVGIGILIIGTIAGSTVSLIIYRSVSLFDFIVKPLYWILLYGAIPAFLIGLIGSITTKIITK